MEVTAKTKDGKEVFADQKVYMTQATSSKDEKMIYGAQWKVGYLRDTSLQPYKTRDESFEIKLPEGVRTVDVTVELTYQLFPGDKIPIHTVTKEVTLDK
ncbi:MAG: hypothetical protein Q8J64_01510 [Thermodesulfovibrionales bacterium]|nr:hypothetical protein [Thermodesulfovibrionales bacterium]